MERKTTISNANDTKRVKATFVKLFLTMVVIFGFQNAFAQRVASVSGNWNSTATWGGAAVPTNAQTVTINAGVSVTVTAAAVCSTLQINNSNGNNVNTTLTINSGNTLTVGATGTGAVTIGSATAMGNGNSNTTSLVVSGNLVCGAIAQSPGARTAGVGGDGRTNLTINSTGIVTATGNVTGTSVNGTGSLTASASLIFSGAGVLNVTGTLSPTVFTPSTGTVNYNGTGAQTITNYPYYNLSISSARTTSDVTFAGSTNIGGNLTISSTSTTGEILFNTTGTGRTFNITGDYIQTGNSCEFGLGSGSSTINLSGNFQKTGGYMVTTTAVNAVFNMVGTTQTMQSTGGTVIKWMDFNIASGSLVTLAGAFNYSGGTTDGAVFTVLSGGTLNCGANNVVSSNVSTFSLASGGTLGIGSSAGIVSSGATGNIQTTTRSFSAGGNYVYNGGIAQAAGTALPATIGSLTVTNNSVLTLPSVKVVTNNFSITAGSSVNLGTFSHTAGTLTLGGSGTPNGSHGSTTSSATYKNNTYFAATSGIVTVGSSTCAAMTAAISGTTAVCTGGSTNLAVAITGGVSPFTVVYSGGTINSYTSGTNIPVSPGSTTAYTLSSVRDSNGCPATNSGTATVTVNAAPAPGALSPSTPAGIVCEGGTVSATLTAGTGGAGTIVDELERSLSGGPFATYTSGTAINTTGQTSVSIRTRRTATGSGCTTSSYNTVNWTVNAVPVSGTLTPTPGAGAVCEGTSVSATLAAGSGGAGTIVDELERSLSGGAYAAYTSGTAISTAGQTSVSIRTRRTATGSGCTSSSYNTVTWTVNARPSSSVISGTAAICAGTSTNLQVAITGGTSPYSVVYSGGSVGSYISGSNISVAPTSTTAYTLTSVTDANGCAGVGNSGTATVSIDSTTSTNGGPWSNGSPSAGKSVIFDGTSVTLGADFAACSLTLVNSSVVTIQSGTDVTLTGAIAVQAGSTFTLNNNANLLQTIPSGTSYTNTGNIIVQRNSSALKRLDYTLWSSPVTGQGVYAFSPYTFGNRFYVYRTNTNVYNNADVGFSLTGLDPNGVNGTDSNNVQFAQAKGYLIRMPWDHPTAATVWNGSYTGVPNNGDIPFTMINGGSGQRFNLVGNPYPSPISMTQFVSDNSTRITGTLYFWRETNLNTSNNAYCSWAGGTFTTNSEAQVFNPNGIVRTGQGFFVEASGAATTLDFRNGQRSSDNSNQFFRSNPNVVNEVETNRFWLNLTNTSGAFSQMAAGYMTDATNGVDIYDGRNINSGNVLLNSILDNTDYTIQGKALPFTASDVVPLSYKVTTAGSYTIAIDHTDGLFEGGTQAIYLKDNLTATEHNLQTGAYNFASDAGTFNNRFEIVYQEQLSNPVFTPNAVVIYSQNEAFVINSGNTIMASVKVFDIRGRLLLEKGSINANQTSIKVGDANQVLLVQITSEDGAVVTKKVIR